MRRIISAALLATALLATGCAQTGKYTGSSYGGAESRRAETVRTGKIIAMSPVRIDANNGNGNPGAEILGVIGGGLLGSLAGAGRGNVAAVIGGAVAGGALASAASKSAADLNGVRFTILLDNKQTIASSQEADAETASMRVGDQVYVYSSTSGTVRVSR